MPSANRDSCTFQVKSLPKETVDLLKESPSLLINTYVEDMIIAVQRLMFVGVIPKRDAFLGQISNFNMFRFLEIMREGGSLSLFPDHKSKKIGRSGDTILPIQIMMSVNGNPTPSVGTYYRVYRAR